MAAGATLKMRSWLFAPGDSERKMEKATAGPADIVLLDLEDAVAPENKPLARKMVFDWLTANPDQRRRLWVRINPLDGAYTADDLAEVMPGRPGGIMLPKSRGRGDLDQLDAMMLKLEAANGIEAGSTPVVVLVIESAQGLFTAGSYGGAPRITAMTWGPEDLSDDLGAAINRNPDGSYRFTYELARSLTLAGAGVAGVSAIETIYADFRNEEGLRATAETARRDGFRGMMAIHPAQVEPINAAFTPNEADLAEAREIVALFAANPGVGTIGLNGKMLDRPHLSRAQQLLAQAEGQ
jgi:citrate lyase subunit beta / citryl-CoA lyase